MAYKEFRQGERARYYVISKQKVRGHHVVTPYRSMPSSSSVGKNRIVVSGNKYYYKINKNGYSTTTKLPQNTINSTKRRTQPQMSFFGFRY